MSSRTATLEEMQRRVNEAGRRSGSFSLFFTRLVYATSRVIQSIERRYEARAGVGRPWPLARGASPVTIAEAEEMLAAIAPHAFAKLVLEEAPAFGLTELNLDLTKPLSPQLESMSRKAREEEARIREAARALKAGLHQA